MTHDLPAFRGKRVLQLVQPERMTLYDGAQRLIEPHGASAKIG